MYMMFSVWLKALGFWVALGFGYNLFSALAFFDVDR
jgi:hypothetical protein